MTDFLPVPPPPDGLRDALRAARGRRWRTASMTSALGASLALVLPLLLGGAGQTVLLPEPDTRQPAVPPTHDHQQGPAKAQAITAGRPAAPGSAAAPQSDTGGRAATVVVHVSARPQPSGPAPQPTTSGPVRRMAPIYTSPDASCAVDADPHPTGLCPTAYAPVPEQDGSYLLSGTLCNVAATDAVLTYATGHEVDLSVWRRADTLWRWSSSHPATGARHDLTLPAGACAQWDTTWAGVDDSGHRLPAGDYQLRVEFLADQLDRHVAAIAFTVG